MASFRVLIDVLEDLYKSQVEMVELAKRKKQVLINGEIDELTKIIQQESNWIKRVGKLEEERLNIVEQFVNEKSIDNSNLTIKELTNIIESPKERAQLTAINEKLFAIIEELQQLNEINTQLIKQSLDYISNTLDSFIVDNKQPYTYNNPSDKQKSMSSGRGIFDKKA